MNEREKLTHDLLVIASPRVSRLSPAGQMAWIMQFQALIAQLFPEDEN
jgi:hypothetical protein